MIHSEMPHINSLFTPVTIAPGVHDVQQALLHTTELTTLIMTTCFDEKKIGFEQCICNNQHTLTCIDIIHIDHWYLLYFDHDTCTYLDLLWGWLVFFFSKSMWFKNEFIAKISEKGVNHSKSKDSSRISLANLHKWCPFRFF